MEFTEAELNELFALVPNGRWFRANELIGRFVYPGRMCRRLADDGRLEMRNVEGSFAQVEFRISSENNDTD